MTRHALGRDRVAPEVQEVRDDSRSMDGSSYLIGAEDVLDISVWKEDALKKEVLVRPDGGISFPLQVTCTYQEKRRNKSARN